MKDPKYITLGCSHTAGTYLSAPDHWINMLEQKTGVKFFPVSHNAAGLSFLVLYINQYIERGEINPDAVRYFVLQKPRSVRYPFWGTDASGYRYIKYDNNPTSVIAVRSGMRLAMKKFAALNQGKKKIISEYIFKKELDLMIELKEMFTNAIFAYYHYWGDHMTDLLYRPILADINVRLGIEATKLSMTNWQMIVNPCHIAGVYDSEGDIIMNHETLYEEGWILSATDTHPVKKYHKLVAQQVDDWLEFHES